MTAPVPISLDGSLRDPIKARFCLTGGEALVEALVVGLSRLQRIPVTALRVDHHHAASKQLRQHRMHGLLVGRLAQQRLMAATSFACLVGLLAVFLRLATTWLTAYFRSITDLPSTAGAVLDVAAMEAPALPKPT